MIRLTAILTLVVLTCFSSGCTTYYYQQNTAIDQCKLDRRLCVAELRKYSTLNQFGEYERKFIENCMKQKGYSLITKNKLPVKVRREEPEQTLHWRIHGIAGTVE